MVVDEQRNKFAVLKYEVIAGKLNEPVTMGVTMQQYLEKLIEDLGIEWHDLTELNVITKVKQ